MVLVGLGVAGLPMGGVEAAKITAVLTQSSRSQHPKEFKDLCRAPAIPVHVSQALMHNLWTILTYKPQTPSPKLYIPSLSPKPKTLNLTPYTPSSTEDLITWNTAISACEKEPTCNS